MRIDYVIHFRIKLINTKHSFNTKFETYLDIMTSPNERTDVRKALFTSPGVDINEKIDDNSLTLNNVMQIEQETETALKNAQKDAHEVRMKKFRQIAKHLSDDDWRYPSIEKLIGLK